MSDLRDEGKSLLSEGLDGATQAVHGWPWYVKLGVPAVILLMIGGAVLSLLGKGWDATTEKRVLDGQDMEIVRAAATRALSGYREVGMDGKAVVGTLIDCSNTDTDKKGTPGYRKVTCNGQIPVKLMAKDGNSYVINMVRRDLDCGIPEKGATGCKLKELDARQSNLKLLFPGSLLAMVGN